MCHRVKNLVKEFDLKVKDMLWQWLTAERSKSELNKKKSLRTWIHRCGLKTKCEKEKLSRCRVGFWRTFKTVERVLKVLTFRNVYWDLYNIKVSYTGFLFFQGFLFLCQDTVSIFQTFLIGPVCVCVCVCVSHKTF